ncbi:MAG TPA: type II toxin-antitoxin system VapC family toxin [Thermoguttaceae bacterium]
MSLPSVYIETTIPSFYFTTRKDVESLARRNWTQHWWDFKREEYELVTSVAVLDELKKGNYAGRDEALKLMENIFLLPTEPAIPEIITAYIQHSVMPSDPGGDAYHLAMASFYKCDFLLTWNCKHLANANKFRHIQRVNTLLRLYIPDLITPMELLNLEP